MCSASAAEGSVDSASLAHPKGDDVVRAEQVPGVM